MIEKIIQWDTQLFLFLNGLHNDFWDTVMWYISDKEFWYPFYALVLIYIFWKYKWHGFLALFFLILLIVCADQGSVQLFKNVFERLRPCHNPEIKDMVHIVNNKCGGQYGFVSSHAANTFAFAMFTGLLFRHRIYTISIFVWAAVVSYSRIYLGVHFPLDILGGALLGILVGIVIFRLYFWVLMRFFSRKGSRQSVEK